MTVAETETLIEELTLQDRCDRCGAAALIKASAPWGELLFCGHHFVENELGLLASGANIYDQRPVLG